MPEIIQTPTEKPRVRVKAASARYSAAGYSSGRYDGTGTGSRPLQGWNVGLDAPEPPGAEYERGTLVARTRDLERNDPLARSAIESRIDNVVGAGWSLTAKPDYRALGISFDAAVDFAEEVETLWSCYVNDPLKRYTAEEDMSFADMMGLAYRSQFRDGEAFAAIPFDDDGGRWCHGTRLQLIDPDRVTNPHNASDTVDCRRGLEITAAGRPLAAHIRARHPQDWTALGDNYVWTRVAFRTPDGRPSLIHHKQITRPGQVRGVSRLAPVIKSLRAVNVFDDAELQSKVTNALFTAFITSDWDVATAAQTVTSEELLAADEARRTYYADHPEVSKNPLGGRVPILPAGDTFKTVDTKRETGEDFVSRVVHNIAAAAGLSYEQLTMNWSEVNYSSARAALLEIHKNIYRDQISFANGFLGPFFLAWMDECFARGTLTPPAGAPEFWDAPAAYCKVRWILPARGWVDPVKEAQAAGIRMNLSITTLEDEAADQGRNWKDNLQQEARVRKTRQDLGLPVMDYRLAVSAHTGMDKSETRDLDPNEHLFEEDEA